mmetsp:Transcript_55156/g.129132  ORF Transcript_55156/g.129132 Transcript_55156/m.129132 type:complete len:535 (+) Transcript_55156:42-1646(+)
MGIWSKISCLFGKQRPEEDAGDDIPRPEGYKASTQQPTSSSPGSLLMEPELRFAVGDRVQCRVGPGSDEDSWAPGTVAKQWYREKQWPPHRTAPYQIKLDNGQLIFAPMDDDRVIKALGGLLAAGKIPVTVLTGFLGAGKTTLLNYILKEHHGRKYAIIENEVGAVGVDNQLLSFSKEETKEDITLLDNGCLCCTVRGDLVDAIKNIVTKAKKKCQEDPTAKALDGIIIETTGIADPGPICKTFYGDMFCQMYCKVDGVLTLVDAKHFIKQLTREREKDAVNESAQQVAFADKVLLNKVDSVSPEELEQVVQAVQGVNAFVPITKCSLAKSPAALPLAELLGIDAFDVAKMKGGGDIDLSMCGAITGGTEGDSGHGEDDCGHGDGHGDDAHGDGHGGGHGGGHGSGHGEGHGGGHGDGHGQAHGHGEASFRHDTGIGSFVCEISGKPMNFEKFRDWMSDLLENSEDLYRYKGILAIKNTHTGKVQRQIIQGVHDMTDMAVDGDWPEGVPLKSQLVLIGKSLDRQKWRESFGKLI